MGVLVRPCREEMPVLQEFHEEYGDRVRVLGVDYAGPAAGSRPRARPRTAASTYPLLADPDGDLDAVDRVPGLRGLPGLVLVDADGRVASGARAEIESDERARRLVDEHLGAEL